MRNHISFGLVALALALNWTTEARAASATLSLQTSLRGTSSSFFGYAVAIDAGTAIVGAINDNNGKGAAYVYTASGGGWALQQVLTSPSSAAGDEFGYAVAVSGNTALVGTASTSDVFVFARSGNAWTPQSAIHDPDTGPQAGDCFGCSIGLAGDTAIIGAPGKANGAGRADLFVRQGNAWSAAQMFAGQPGESYGFSVALSPDTGTALAGAFGASNETGVAHVLTKGATGWLESQVLSAPDAAPSDRFGYSVALQNDVALVGAYQHGGRGAAYVFNRTGGGWSSLAPALAAPDGAANDAFGISVALTTSIAVIGAYDKSGPLGPGAAYVFTKSGDSWSSSQQLFADAAGQYFGYAVAASGNAAIVGAFGAPDASAISDAGAAYVFAAPAKAPALGTPSRWLVLALALGGIGLLVLSKRHGEKLA